MSVIYFRSGEVSEVVKKHIDESFCLMNIETKQSSMLKYGNKQRLDTM